MSAANRDRKIGQRSRMRLMGIDWAQYAARPPLPSRNLAVTVIDEAHVIVTGSYTQGAPADVYKSIADQIVAPVKLGHPAAGYDLACGSCPRSMRCLQGRPPGIICPQCRRTSHDHNAPFTHLFRGDPEGYRLIDNFGQKVAEWFDYVPSSCPLWVRRDKYIVDKEPCPLCKNKTKVTAIHVLYTQPTRHRRLLCRLSKPRRPKQDNTMRTFLERRYGARFKQTVQRPPRRTAAR